MRAGVYETEAGKMNKEIGKVIMYLYQNAKWIYRTLFMTQKFPVTISYNEF